MHLKQGLPKSPAKTLLFSVVAATMLTVTLRFALGLTPSEAIYAVTGLLVLWYGVEARAMRREMGPGAVFARLSSRCCVRRGCSPHGQAAV